MSKSQGNYIGVAEPTIDIVNKTMKSGDALMWDWIELLSFEIGIDEAKRLKADVAAGAPLVPRQPWLAGTAPLASGLSPPPSALRPRVS